GCGGRRGTHSCELSGGEHEGGPFAGALVQQLSLLRADEPIASLDPELSEQILTLLCDLASETGFALFCSLHQQEYAYKYFDRVIRIQHGAVETENGSRLAATQSGAAD